MTRDFRENYVVPIGIACAVIIPVAITLSTVRVPGRLQIPSDNPTPLGYTWSLLLFVFPLAVLSACFLRQPDYPLQRAAFWKTVAVLTPLGLILDVFFGNYFFVFKNRGAVLGLDFPALGGGFPVEEIFFYLTGNILVLLTYIWNDEHWVAAYRSDALATPRPAAPTVRFHPGALVFGLAVWGGAVAYKKLLSDVPGGMPWYLTYLLAVSVVPCLGFFPSVRRLVNWRAFSMTFLVMLLISIVWETTLGVPYGWWGYNHEVMTGLFIAAWHNLPVEAVLVWLAVTYTAVILYEVFRLRHSAAEHAAVPLFEAPRVLTTALETALRAARWGSGGRLARVPTPDRAARERVLAAHQRGGGRTWRWRRPGNRDGRRRHSMRPARSGGCTSPTSRRGLR